MIMIFSMGDDKKVIFSSLLISLCLNTVVLLIVVLFSVMSLRLLLSFPISWGFFFTLSCACRYSESNHSSISKAYLSPNYHKNATSKVCYYAMHVSIQSQHVSHYIPLSISLTIVCDAKKRCWTERGYPRGCDSAGRLLVPHFLSLFLRVFCLMTTSTRGIEEGNCTDGSKRMAVELFHCVYEAPVELKINYSLSRRINAPQINSYFDPRWLRALWWHEGVKGGFALNLNEGEVAGDLQRVMYLKQGFPTFLVSWTPST